MIVLILYINLLNLSRIQKKKKKKKKKCLFFEEYGAFKNDLNKNPNTYAYVHINWLQSPVTKIFILIIILFDNPLK